MIGISGREFIQVERKLGAFRDKAPIVLSRAINRAAENARTNVVEKVTESYHIKKKDVRSTIKISKASRKDLRATVASRGTRRPLIQFKVSQNKETYKYKRKPKKLKVAVRKDTGLKEIINSFVSRGMKKGNLMVLQRTSKMRYPIFQKYGPAVPQMIGIQRIRPYIENQIREMLNKRIDHEIKRVLEGGK